MKRRASNTIPRGRQSSYEDGMPDPGPAARHAPATQRNREPILAVLREVLPAGARVLEIAAGTGEHAAHFAPALRPSVVRWQPTDRDADALPSIAAWREAAGPPDNLEPPIALDVSRPWPVAVGAFDTIFCANMIHIAPWQATLDLLAGAARHLAAPARVVLYGPFMIGGAHTAPSNEAFDAGLRARDRAWGVRDLDVVLAEAARHGLVEARRVAMPANNFVVVLERGRSPAT